MLVAVSEELEADFLRQPAKGGEIDLSRDIPLAWLGEWVVEPLVILEREERPVCAMGGVAVVTRLPVVNGEDDAALELGMEGGEPWLDA